MLDNELIKHVITDLHQRGDTWLTGAIIMGIIAIASIVRLIFR